MTEQQFLTAKEFIEKSGIPSQTLTKLLREGQIKGEKISGKWAIPQSELKSSLVPVGPKTGSAESKIPDNPTFSIAEFSRMTYLTEKGVLDWLKRGLLIGQLTSREGWRVDAANLEVPNVRRLVRKP
jgi:hypothetical protein